MKKLLKISLTLFLTAVIVLGFAVPVNMVGNWYQQFLPNIGSQLISDVTFLDSLIGYAVTESTPINDTAYILKTTNGGDNWIIKHRSVDDYSRIMFANSNTGFTAGGDLLKTTNAGENWLSINRPNQTKIDGMHVLNNDTIWLVDSDGLVGGVFRTTNGGVNWTVNNTYKPDKIYMYNRDTGFSSRANTFLYKTTDSGLNWTQITGENGFRDIYFINSQTGWKANGPIKKTTNGGLNWIAQVLPTGGILISSGALKLSVLNRDTLWAVGAEAFYGGGQTRGVIYRTTNGGDNWLFQVPDTAIPSNTYYSHIQFINARVGWAHTQLIGVHTTNGGDITWLVGVKQISSEIPQDYKLFQNYPNPFNPATNIKFKIPKTGFVSIIIYSITGKEVTQLVNKKLSAGIYETDFKAINMASGVYLYSLIVDGRLTDTKKMLLVK